ncbi:MAG: LPS export ABC transporter ATP-binding protein [Spirochaetota bacterium]|nr:LPS export ABC transporter ATP-binding protein [Spirochaetota bacterium]
MSIIKGSENIQILSGLVANNLRKSYGKRLVVKGISIHVQPGEVVGLLGPNGAGKTTTFSMLVGLLRPNDGEVLLDGDNITHLRMYQRARRGVGYLPQELSIFRKLSVEDNIRSVLEIRGLNKDEINTTVESLLTDLGLHKIRKQLGYTLSGGEKRRTEVARILAIQPRFLLMDEPFTGIDPIAIADIQRLVLELRSKWGLGILITDHNVRETLKIVDRTYICYDGQILVSGTAQDLVENEEARRTYLGSDFTI